MSEIGMASSTGAIIWWPYTFCIPETQYTYNRPQVLL